MACQSCGYSRLEEVIDFGDQMICNKVISEGEIEKLYPLKLVYCPICTLIQLSDVPPASEVFGKDFNYLTGSSKEAVDYFDGLAERLVRRFSLTSSDLVLDIASNDGTFLQGFKRRGVKVLGIEPTSISADIAEKNGISTIVSRFEDADLDGIRPTIITAMNVLAHTDTLHPFMDKLVELMVREKSFFVSQSQEVFSLMRQGTFDTIYHEHARYFSFESLEYLFKIHGLSIYDSTHTDYYGGSILAFAMPSTQITELISEFKTKVETNKKSLRDMVASIKFEGKKIAGIGAPMKASTLLSYCELDSSKIDYLCETNPLKIGKLSPGTHIPIMSDDYFFANPPDVALILSWNLADGIMKRFRERGYRGSYLIPMPSPRLVS